MRVELNVFPFPLVFAILSESSNTVDLGQIDVNPEKGYFVIPAKTVSFEAIDKSVSS